MILYLIRTILTISLLCLLSRADVPADPLPPKVINGQTAKPAPQRPPLKADVEVEWSEPAEPCEAEKICIQGQLYNGGLKTAYRVEILVMVGATNLTKPKAVIRKPAPEPVMNPGDRQDFGIEINRKISYRERDQDLTIEVGKYNYHLKAAWKDAPAKKRPARHPHKSKSLSPHPQ